MSKETNDSPFEKDYVSLVELLLGWDRVEKSLSSEPVVDFNVTDHRKKLRLKSRYGTLAEFQRLREKSKLYPTSFASQLEAHETFLRALLGERFDFATYVNKTIGIPVTQFSEVYIEKRQAVVHSALQELKIDFDAKALESLERQDTLITGKEISRSLRSLFQNRIGHLESIVGKKLDMSFKVRFVSVNAYWNYWVDGTGNNFRFRINGINQSFGLSELEQFVYHELLAHCCQVASWRQEILSGRMSIYHGLTTVHGPEQFLFEGLAQCLPLFMRSFGEFEPLLRIRILLSHLRLIVLHNVHIMLNRGDCIVSCVEYVTSHLPFTRPGKVADGLASRSNHVLFRTYQFVYGFSFDYFMRLSELLDQDSKLILLRRFYTESLYYRDFAREFNVDFDLQANPISTI